MPSPRSPTAHARGCVRDTCRHTSERLGRYVRDAVSPSERESVEEHLEHCDRCVDLASELRQVDAAMRAVLVPAVLGGSAAAYLAELGGEGAATAAAAAAASEASAVAPAATAAAAAEGTGGAAAGAAAGEMSALAGAGAAGSAASGTA